MVDHWRSRPALAGAAGCDRKGVAPLRAWKLHRPNVFHLRIVFHLRHREIRDLKLIPTSVHGVLDYVVGVILIIAPWVLGFAQNGAETWVPVIWGAGMIVAALFTDYELGAFPVIPMPVHLTIDVVAGLILAVSPWLFQFYGRVWAPHLVIGLFEAIAALLTQTQASYSSIGRRMYRQP
jgi:hypothetical protein